MEQLAGYITLGAVIGITFSVFMTYKDFYYHANNEESNGYVNLSSKKHFKVVPCDCFECV